MEKRFWEVKDYHAVYREIRFDGPEGVRYPELKNPETAPAFKKIIDRKNFEAVLNDDQLGVKHRNSVATDFFDEYKDFHTLYYITDRQDKFEYGRELIEIAKFGLDLQLRYFKLGNDDIIQEADDPNSARIRKLIRSNENTICKNFNNYLDYVNKESAFNEDELKAFSEGIDDAFTKLYEVFPEANKNITRSKAELMLKKAKNESVKKSLESLLENIAEPTS